MKKIYIFLNINNFFTNGTPNITSGNFFSDQSAHLVYLLAEANHNAYIYTLLFLHKTGGDEVFTSDTA